MQLKPEPMHRRRALTAWAKRCSTIGRSLPRRAESLNARERSATLHHRQACKNQGIPLMHLSQGVRKRSTTLHHRQRAHGSRAACKCSEKSTAVPVPGRQKGGEGVGMPDRLQCTQSRTPEGLSEGPQVSKAKPTAPQAEGERRWVPDQRAKAPGESHPPTPARWPKGP